MAAQDVTGTVTVGRFALEVGGRDGTVIAPRAGETDRGSLSRALREERAKRRRSIGEVSEGAVASASEVTARAEEALGLFNAVVSGEVLDPKQLAARVDRLLELVQKLDREGRWDEALRLARSLCGLLALLMRWAELVGSLRVAMRAAEQIGDLSAFAWANHEIGTLHLAAENPAAAERGLGQAQEVRQQLGDQRALAVTERNLGVLCRNLRELAREGRLERQPDWRRRIAAAAALLALLLVGGVAGAVVEHNRSTVDDTQSQAAVGGPPVRLAVHPLGPGTVTSTPAGIRCPPRCRGSFVLGTQVALSAHGTGGARFAGWSGACDGTGGCRVTLDRPRSVSARFASAPSEAVLTVEKRGAGTGTVRSEPSGIDCGSACTASRPPGTPVRLTAEADDGSVFERWSGADCPGTGPCDVTVDRDRRVVAYFGEQPTEGATNTLSVLHAGKGAGDVTSDPAGISCGLDCTAEFPADQRVVLTAKPVEGSEFVGWSGSGCTGTSTCTVPLDAARSVTATFEPVNQVT